MYTGTINKLNEVPSHYKLKLLLKGTYIFCRWVAVVVLVWCFQIFFSRLSSRFRAHCH